MAYTFHTEQRKVKDLIPFESNPRQLSEKQKEDLEKSLIKFGLVEIPAINTNDRIISGHQRLKILSLLGKAEEIIDVRVPNKKLNKKDFEEYNIRANKNSGSWDFDILANEFEFEDLLNWGFDEDELGIINEDLELEDMNIEKTYEIVVECVNEKEQEKYYNKLIKEGYECRLLTL